VIKWNFKFNKKGALWNSTGSFLLAMLSLFVSRYGNEKFGLRLKTANTLKNYT